MRLLGRKLTKEQLRLWSTLLFAMKLLVFVIPLYIILAFSQILAPLQAAVSYNIIFLLRAIGLDAAGQGMFISIGGSNPFLFLISEDCTGWKSMLLLTALMCAVPAITPGKRLIGLLIGIPVVYAGNLVRIMIVVMIQQSSGLATAMVFHDYLWQLGLIILVLAEWFIWLAWAKGLLMFKRKAVKHPGKGRR
jgi:exosortase/archaeosortase family protein